MKSTNYAIVLHPDATKVLARLPEEPYQILKKHLQLLGANPVKLGERAGHPHPERGQLYRFKKLFSERRYYFTVFFVFGDSQTENTLLVTDIVIQIVG